MKLTPLFSLTLAGTLAFSASVIALAQPPFGEGGFPPGGGGFPGQGGGRPGGGFPGGPGMMQERKLVKDFDKDNNGWLDNTERKTARAFIKEERANNGGRGGGFRPPRFGGGENQEPPKPGVRVAVANTPTYPDAKLYDPKVLRTIFLEFENADWESELEDFHNTDVDVTATLTVDGKKYPNVGIHFRGMSSYMMVQAGYKRSLNVSLDLADPKQRLYGYKTINLLNAHEDASFLSTALYSHIARQYIPAPKANLVKVAINGENWGVYTNVQQFDKIFVEENFPSQKKAENAGDKKEKGTSGARWKVSGNPGGGGGLEYLGDDPALYKQRYEIKSGDNAKHWQAFVNLCKILNQTPPAQLEAALKPILDTDSLLWFLALDVALINNDGYWIRASDYSIYLDPENKFHIIPHDMNESFRAAGGPGFGGGGGFPGGGGRGGQGGGFPGGPGMMMALPRPGEVMPQMLQQMLQLSDIQQRQFAQLQREIDTKMTNLLTPAQRNQLKSMQEMMQGGFPGGGMPPDAFVGGGAPPPGGGGFPGGGQGGGRPGGQGGGRPGGMGQQGGGLELDPLVGLEDTRKPLRSRILAVPSLKAKYLQNIRTIAAEALDWNKLGAVVAQYRTLIDKEVQADTRKLESYEAFKRATADTTPAPAANAAGNRGRQGVSLRAFADGRRNYLLKSVSSNAGGKTASTAKTP